MLQFDADGAPINLLYRDVYRSRHGAWAEAQSVFVTAARSSPAWHRSASFNVLELGFGLGVNFLATCHAQRSDTDSPRRIHYVALERHPLSTRDLERAHAALGLTSQGHALREHWPCLTPGTHRLSFDHDRVILWLVIGDARSTLPGLRLGAHAIYLDGFAPARNPEMWEPALIRQLGRLSEPGARLATYSAAGAVREALADSGFSVQLVAGHSGKRHRIDATYAPRWRTWAPPPAAPVWANREAVVVGGGLSGWAVAGRLAQEGWSVHLIDEGSSNAAARGSAQPWLAEHPHLSPDDNLLARATRVAMGLRRAASVRLENPPARSIGRLMLADGDEGLAQQQRCIDALDFPQSFARMVNRGEAQDIAGIDLPRGGLWMPQCSVEAPQSLMSRQQPHAGAQLRVTRAVRVERISHEQGFWTAWCGSGLATARGSVLILCNAGDARRLAGASTLGLRRVRGQTSWLRVPALAGLRTVLSGPAYALPAGQGTLVGASFDELDSPIPDAQSDASNVRRLARVLDHPPQAWLDSVHSASVGFRWTTADRMPVIGAVVDELAMRAARADIARNDKQPIPRLPGLFTAHAFGSRGLLWADLAAETIAASVLGEPLPLDMRLLAAMDPAREIRRRLRRCATG